MSSQLNKMIHLAQKKVITSLLFDKKNLKRISLQLKTFFCSDNLFSQYFLWKEKPIYCYINMIRYACHKMKQAHNTAFF